jgi:hypothetical protein
MHKKPVCGGIAGQRQYDRDKCGNKNQSYDRAGRTEIRQITIVRDNGRTLACSGE